MLSPDDQTRLYYSLVLSEQNFKRLTCSGSSNSDLPFSSPAFSVLLTYRNFALVFPMLTGSDHEDDEYISKASA